MVAPLCEHCEKYVSRAHCVTRHAGKIYHDDCHKCYVCSESNLQGCEVFKGAIFCSDCAKRIFQGCASAREAKMRTKRSPVSATQQAIISFFKSHKRQSARAKLRTHHKRCLHLRNNGVIEIANHERSAHEFSTDTDSTEPDSVNNQRQDKVPTDKRTSRPQLQIIKSPTLCYNKSSQIESENIEQATAAYLIQQLLEHINITVTPGGNESKGLSSQDDEKGEMKPPTSSEIKKEIIEIGTLTNILQQLLEKMNNPIEGWGELSQEYGEVEQSTFDYDRGEVKQTSGGTSKGSNETVTTMKHVTDQIMEGINYSLVASTKSLETVRVEQSTYEYVKSTNRMSSHKSSYIDMRVAELGMSTEIASCGLRKRSGTAIKSRSKLSHLLLISGDDTALDEMNSDWMNRSLSELSTPEKHEYWKRFTRTRFGYFVTDPFRFFHSRVLRRSSLISIIMSFSKENRSSKLKQLKSLFLHDEVTDHHRRGIRRLYSTIKRRRIPYKLGWLHLEGNETKRPACRHLLQSHSYRCFRNHVMTRAGPTKSELNNFWSGMSNLFTMEFYRKLFNIERRQQSRSCGKTETTIMPLTRKNTDLLTWT